MASENQGEIREGKPVFQVFRGISAVMNPRQARDLVRLLFEIDDLEPHLFAFAEQINNTLIDPEEHPTARRESA